MSQTEAITTIIYRLLPLGAYILNKIFALVSCIGPQSAQNLGGRPSPLLPSSVLPSPPFPQKYASMKQVKILDVDLTDLFRRSKQVSLYRQTGSRNIHKAITLRICGRYPRYLLVLCLLALPIISSSCAPILQDGSVCFSEDTQFIMYVCRQLCAEYITQTADNKSHEAKAIIHYRSAVH